MSHPKASPENRSYRSSRPRKKLFQGNQFSDQIESSTNKKNY